MIDNNKTKWEDMKISVLGAGKTGVSVSKLARFIGLNVFLSDINHNKVNISNDIEIELGGHTERVLEADLIIKSPGIPNDIPILQEAVKNKINIISEIEFSSWFSKIPIIGITGSNGKTTTVNLLNSIFKNNNFNPLVGGNIGTPFSDNVINELLNPNKFTVHILELSSFQLEHVFKLSLEVGCILNISEDHLDRYKDYDEYVNSKLNIIRSLKDDGILVYDKNNYELKERIKDTKNSISFNHEDIVDTGINLESLLLKGEHNYSNIMAASRIASLFDIRQKIINKTIEKFHPLPHRLEFIGKLKGSLVYNDSKATNIGSMIAAIESFKHNIVLLLGGIDKCKSNFLNPINTYKNRIKFVACYGDSGQDIFNQIKQVVQSSYNYSFSDSVTNAIDKLNKNDVLLLSPGCASFDQFKSYEDRGHEFKKIIIGLT